ncbi:hypothetical protein GMORB2_0071 [Geosmithia morbida]|uniref:Extracellular serine-rich protein n=1 Tax=Geosmithia morbida TaxID=1094350 RepID=A0A9P5D821_9HYPO|nr:uncharacterized protein GMORB2_0071 [Geosmithia morbida]KAF4126335.1 hypothetical protein GMORB2_0071 [Geosmithia morbida]
MQFSTILTAMLMGVASAVDVQVVYVGWNPANNKTGKSYWPEKITAKAGSMVQFQFWTGNHTVTQSGFDAPCEAMADGIQSGYMPVDASAADAEIPTYTIMVNDTKPLWFYCAQATHCEEGMSLVINENTTSGKTLASYKTSSAALLDDGTTTGGDAGNGTDTGSGSGTDSGTGTGTGSGTDSGTDSGTGTGTGTTTGDADNVVSGGSNSTTGTDRPQGAGSTLAIPSSMLMLAVGAAFALL